jgi:diguanylate cyclase (GGDEF)-like protein/PAS domain S-box-containing protein
VAVAELDASGRIVHVNQALADLLGRPPEPVAGRVGESGWSLSDTDLESAVADMIVAVKAGQARPQLLRLRHDDGGRRFVRVRAGLADPGDPGAGYLVVLDDVTAEHDLTERLADQAAQTEDRLRQVFDASPDGFAVYHAVRAENGQVTNLVLAMLNAAGLADTGWSAESVIGMDVRHVIPQAEESGFFAQMVGVLDGVPPQLRRYGFDAPGRRRVLEGRSVKLDADTLLVTWRDVTDVVEGERLLGRAYEETAEMRATLQTALDATSDCFAVYALEWDEDRFLTGLRVLHANAAACASLRLEPDEMVNRELRELFPEVERSGLWQVIVEAALTKAPLQHRVHLFAADGEWLSSWDNTVAPVGEERMAITWRDVSAEESALRQLARHRDEAMHTATHDPLTGLPNRILLRDHLAQALRTCRRHQRVGIVFVDLDRFKLVNDTYGHAAGDAVLCATARRLGRVVRQGDLAARLAGDEFVLVLTALAPDWAPGDFFARATALLTEPVWADGVKLYPGASLGAVLCDPHAGPTDPEALIKEADAAMYAVKAARRTGR